MERTGARKTGLEVLFRFFTDLASTTGVTNDSLLWRQLEDYPLSRMTIVATVNTPMSFDISRPRTDGAYWSTMD